MSALVVDGRSIALSDVGTNDGLNYGDLGDSKVHTYDFSATAEEVIQVFSATFDKLVAEMREDDRLDSTPTALRRMGYPTLREAFLQPSDLAEVVATFLHREILEHFCPFDERNRFIINSTDQVHVTGSTLNLVGRCFARP